MSPKGRLLPYANKPSMIRALGKPTGAVDIISVNHQARHCVDVDSVTGNQTRVFQAHAALHRNSTLNFREPLLFTTSRSHSALYAPRVSVDRMGNET